METVGDVILQLVAQQGVAVALVAVGAIMAVWSLHFYFTTVWPAHNQRAIQELELRAREAEVQAFFASTLGQFRETVEALHAHLPGSG